MPDTLALLEERAKTHGDFKETAETIQQLKGVIRAASKPHTLTFAQWEALEMIAHKMGRIVNGDPNTKDHWDDIAGYAKLISIQIS